MIHPKSMPVHAAVFAPDVGGVAKGHRSGHGCAQPGHAGEGRCSVAHLAKLENWNKE